METPILPFRQLECSQLYPLTSLPIPTDAKFRKDANSLIATDNHHLYIVADATLHIFAIHRVCGIRLIHKASFEMPDPVFNLSVANFSPEKGGSVLLLVGEEQDTTYCIHKSGILGILRIPTPEQIARGGPALDSFWNGHGPYFSGIGLGGVWALDTDDESGRVAFGDVRGGVFVIEFHAKALEDYLAFTGVIWYETDDGEEYEFEITREVKDAPRLHRKKVMSVELSRGGRFVSSCSYDGSHSISDLNVRGKWHMFFNIDHKPMHGVHRIEKSMKNTCRDKRIWHVFNSANSGPCSLQSLLGEGSSTTLCHRDRNINPIFSFLLLPAAILSFLRNILGLNRRILQLQARPLVGKPLNSRALPSCNAVHSDEEDGEIGGEDSSRVSHEYGTLVDCGKARKCSRRELRTFKSLFLGSAMKLEEGDEKVELTLFAEKDELILVSMKEDVCGEWQVEKEHQRISLGADSRDTGLDEETCKIQVAESERLGCVIVGVKGVGVQFVRVARAYKAGTERMCIEKMVREPDSLIDGVVGGVCIVDRPSGNGEIEVWILYTNGEIEAWEIDKPSLLDTSMVL